MPTFNDRYYKLFMGNFYDFELPVQHLLAQSDALSALIQTEIKQQDGISFADFMQLALYHPQFGFYVAANFADHFVTAPLISDLFATCLAQQISELFADHQHENILELGAGNGQLMCDLLQKLANKNHHPQYYIYEVSSKLRKLQLDLINKTHPQFAARVHFLAELPEKFSGVIIANEVLDAQPCKRFIVDDNAVHERCVALDEDGFTWQTKPFLSATMNKRLRSICKTYELFSGYESEFNLQTYALVYSLASRLQSGAILFFDYGYGREEYYHPQRNRGTLTCFYQHRAHSNPFLWPGLQDISAHVDFTSVAEAASNADCVVAGYTSQAAFLLSCDLMAHAQVAEKNLSTHDQVALHQAIKILTMPTEMGEVVKVMAITKNIEATLRGFALKDRRRDL